MKNKIPIIIGFLILIFIVMEVWANGDFRIFRQIDRGDRSFYMELLIENPTREKLESEIQSLLKKYSREKSLQIDIFDDLEALQRRGDEKYPTLLINKHWLVSITNKGVFRFYIKERPDIK